MKINKSKPKRKPKKFTGSGKVVVAALSTLTFLGGWNITAQLENQGDPVENTPPVSVAQGNTLPIAVSPTPWPSIAPLAELPPVPTLVSTLTSATNTGNNSGSTVTVPETSNLAPVQIAPLPTLAPLPDMPALPTPPPLPPPPPMPAGGWAQSGGS